ncbi:MAG: hypothetical protein ABJA67_10630 [Chthonomonadales bacterium]
MITATAPGRCGIVGNPTDMYGGSVISISTVERATCRITPSNILRVLCGGEEAIISSVDELMMHGDKLDIARAVLAWYKDRFRDITGTIELTTDIPMQAGMAGSTSLVVATLGAVNRLLQIEMSPWQIAESARKIENRIMGVMCGFQDQHMAVFGGLNYMDFAGKEQLQVSEDELFATIEPLADYVQPLGLIAAHTGVAHHSGTVHTSPRQRWLNGDRDVIGGYKQIAGLARKAKKALLNGDLALLGEYMNANHAITASLGGSGEANERLISAAREAGALGAKLAGAGGGGTILVLATNRDEMIAALKAAGSDRIMFPTPSPGLKIEVSE